MTTDIQYFEGTVLTFNAKYTNTGLVPPPRQCIRETFSEGPAPGCVSSPWIKVWTFHYSDGTIEQLRRIIEK